MSTYVVATVECHAAGTCYCRKRIYISKLEARRFLSSVRSSVQGHQGRMSVYECPDVKGIFHIGHTRYRHRASRRRRGLDA